ncbi:MAG: autotransporter outer membrane beta-barrel domain-containing protein [Phascolarctobacterium sp.]|uniref:autotransporter outer membrane beta-barrel domain-containing protein n=1 Tax=Phascolarctobacterium sp. TaxID=2049039 RepID=UPI0026DDCA39|nr:autotransporter outer membrane beta-barrel domain-containing protein [Phascolarctobacterium sp.]MDO4922302.1 autotransporter outer membrane beta-barrel domain-containing protein [Phascolarctobacterium sp.]
MDDKLKVNNLKITLSDGAQWNPELVKEEGELGGANGTKGSRYIALNNLNLNNGIVNIDVAKTQEQAIQVENLGGTGGTVNFTVDKTGGALKTGTFQVFAGAEATQVSTNYTGINADDIGTKEKFKGLVQESLKIGENSKATFTAHIEEGLLTPAMTGVTTNNINGNTIELQDIQQGKSTTTMDAMRDIASTAIIAWRQEDSTLSQRLGELRNSEGDQGVWVRMSRGEFEYSGAYKNQYNYFQMGYDKAYGDWHYGAAISHNDGQTAYANGKGDNRSTSLSLYGTWLGASGQYADIVLKQGRLSNEFEIHTAAGDTRGDYDAWGTSLSGEYGVKMDMSDGWYVTPQAQLTFMRIGGEDYTTSNNIRVSQDTLYSTVGRVGFELGKNITDKGSVYAKASLLHEFAGDADTYLRLGDLHNSYSQDIGNTWYEAGLGFNYKTGADSYVYADVVKTFGDDIKTPWQWNVGMRWSF